MTAGIYRIVNAVDGRSYIGSAVDIKLRWRAHRTTLRHGRHHNRPLQAAWIADGAEAFAFEILEVLADPNEPGLLAAERRWIDGAAPIALYNSAVGVSRPTAGNRRQPPRPRPRSTRRIVCHLTRLLQERGMSLMALHRATGAAYSNLHAMASGKTRRFEEKTLDAICRALGCSVGDILEHVPEGRA